MRRSSVLFLAVALLAPGLFLAPAWPLAGLGADEDDTLYYYPNRVQFARFAARGEPPWISPWNGLGRPFLADPQSAVFYPPTWLFAVLPATTAYAAVLWLHYSLAIAGAAAFLRAQRVHVAAATFGAVVFGLAGFMVAHRAHFTMVCAGAWTPIVFLAFERLAQRGTPRAFALAAAAAAAQMFAGHVQIAALTALGSLVYLAGSNERRARVILRWLTGWSLAGLLFSVQWLPTFSYVRFCTRADRGYADFVENSWNPVSVAGMLLPMAFGQRTPNFFSTAYWGPSHQVEQFAYIGVFPLLLAFATWWLPVRMDHPARRMRHLLIFSVLLALGLFGPICPLLYWMPGASVFRVPARAMLLVNFALASLAAFSLDALLAAPNPTNVCLRATLQAWTRRPGRAGAALLGVALLIVALTAVSSPWNVRAAGLRSLWPGAPAVWVPLLVIFSTVASLALCARAWRTPALWCLPIAIAAADLAIIGWMLDVPTGGGGTAQYLDADVHRPWIRLVPENSGRLWVVTRRDFSRPGLGALWGIPGEYIDPREKASPNISSLDRIPALNDYGPLQPSILAARFGFEPWGETKRAEALLRNPAWMSDFNVGWVLLCDESLPVPPGGELIWSGGALRLVRTGRSHGEFFFAGRNDGTTAIECVEARGARIRLHVRESTEQRRLVVSRLALPGWRATVNGVTTPVGVHTGCLLAADLPLGTGSCDVELIYEPPGLRAGAALSAAGLAVTLIAASLRSRRRPATA